VRRFGAVSSCFNRCQRNALISSCQVTLRTSVYGGCCVYRDTCRRVRIVRIMATHLHPFSWLATPQRIYYDIGGACDAARTARPAFVTSFRDRFSLGALVTFIVTVADLPIFNIGAAFWGLLAGVLTSWFLERADFRT